MRPDLIVLPEPDIDSDLSLFRAVEPFDVEHFSTESSIEALVVAIFPRAARIDLHRLDTDPSEPVLKLHGDELRAIV